MKSLDAFIVKDEISIRGVFGARLLVDIHQVLGKELSIPYRELLQRAAAAKFSLGITIDEEITTADVRNLSVTAPREIGKTWGLGKQQKKAMNTTFMINEAIKGNAVVKFKFQR